MIKYNINSVVNALISIERFMERPPVALSLHVPRLKLPLLEVVRHPSSDVVVGCHVAEIVQCEFLNLRMIAIREANHIGSAEVLVLSQMSGCHGLEAIAHHVTVKLHEHTD